MPTTRRGADTAGTPQPLPGGQGGNQPGPSPTRDDLFTTPSAASAINIAAISTQVAATSHILNTSANQMTVMQDQILQQNSQINGYSKYAFAYPCKKQTTDTAISMMQKIFLQNGYATVVVSDNGPAFSSVKWKTFLFNNGIRASYCSSYTPSSNKSECLNKQIKYNLGCILKEYSIQHKNWSKFLNFVIFNYNNSFKNTINTTPAEVYFGRKLITPFIIINELTNLVTSSVKPSQQQINDALKLAHQQRLNRTLNRPSVSKYRIGQLVMVKNLAPNINKNKSAKFTAKYNGPYKIQKFTSPTSVRLKPTNSNKSTFGMSIYNLRPYYK
ncbi:uncharacterized protein K02A2.6-like [Chrysoperla carnea]|uniref:uncharacterized protein K02A2.6-like n=1 Tax=Chrysoperla carnea TaxID=189513 RepID=UPI001D06D592|nr:uncharacterized protein K02A2.6-like [Chrysoperla carnea]XP_044730024.1 uncharacterized protein K02A2.6-like [Chrysoperla carnea]XP_044733933.1 uncharacterized protein K02A2.6-like [Chrysoperla carnea]XP_044734025.1 uncharacterized protein K02A2.6-like [Chrysoperla carnea]XP_044734460.1 uncharacterized protein K02A2.6-like [Chrysoperla carnea]XP_044735442.1 uncharacterized protein K02A2.6-like [Chrysoperla carnea]XP_044735705.1 uncharacterized protein K02A2.6-like [Chrysoperla carnea]XP_0